MESFNWRELSDSAYSYAKKPLVFVVDDDKAVRQSLKFVLELEGFNVQVCESGPTLLRQDKLGEAACLLIDYQMPAMNGLELVAELSRRGIQSPVILMTGKGTPELHRRARALRLDHIVEKPLMDSALSEALRTLLEVTH